MTLLERVRQGEPAAIARMISRVERGAPGVHEDLAELYRTGGRMRVVGVAGPPGSGKSTLVGAMAAALRGRGETVGILAIDPSSPLHGGAILGDRIRMAALSDDEGVFIRSMATRGCLGGLSHATADAVTVLDAAGIDVALIETVGLGQDEVEIGDLAQTTVVVSVPGLGDDIQALKAGLLEIADVHVVNKADLPGAGATIADLKNTLHLVDPSPGQWTPPVLDLVASSGQGVPELLVAVDEHLQWMERSGDLDRRLRASLTSRICDLAQEMLARRLDHSTYGDVPGVIDDVVKRRRDPYNVALELIHSLGDEEDERSPGGRTMDNQHAGSLHHPLTDPSTLTAVEDDLAGWEGEELTAFVERQPERLERFETLSGLPVERVYTPLDVAGTSWEDIGLPGRPPFTRGPYPTMHRGRLWTMRQIAGFGTPAETNARFKYLIEQGQTGLSIDFDMPTLMGLDSDDPRSVGEVGREGVAIDVLDDMEELFNGIDLEAMSVSMTINPSAWILLAMYVAVAEARGYNPAKLSGTIQNDILKEYIAQKEWIYPIRPSVRIVRDTVAYCSHHMPRYNPINISGYHISEAGSNAIQEAAFTMAATQAYVEEFVRSGLDVDDFAPRLSFFFVAQADFFEEVAKFRALRRVYATMMRDRFGAKKPESMRLRFHAQTAAATLTRAQPVNNVVRTTLQALAAVLGGTQSLHTNGLDEAYTIPSEQAMKIALRTQQIIAYETNVANSIDPLAGSYLVESLTSTIEREIWAYLDRIAEMGGTIAAIEQNFFQREIADNAYKITKRKASGEMPVIGVNSHIDAEAGEKIEVHSLDPESEQRKIDRLRQVKAERDQVFVDQCLERLKQIARDEHENLMEPTIEAVKARASMGEIVNALKEVMGVHVEVPVF
jgi:methylmalonyl-CoA mutase N-terminal domain/subunit